MVAIQHNIDRTVRRPLRSRRADDGSGRRSSRLSTTARRPVGCQAAQPHPRADRLAIHPPARRRESSPWRSSQPLADAKAPFGSPAARARRRASLMSTQPPSHGGRSSAWGSFHPRANARVRLGGEATRRRAREHTLLAHPSSRERAPFPWRSSRPPGDHRSTAWRSSQPLAPAGRPRGGPSPCSRTCGHAGAVNRLCRSLRATPSRRHLSRPPLRGRPRSPRCGRSRGWQRRAAGGSR